MEHVCIACKRRRSTTYHEQHPLTSDRRPTPGVCSRCIRKLSEPGKSSLIATKEVHHHHYYEVHHHHYPANQVKEATSPLDLPAFCAELSSETHYHHQTWTNDGSPPPVYPGTKPTLLRESGRQREDIGRDIMDRNSAMYSDVDSIERHGNW
jgi:hypothetical protein